MDTWRKTTLYRTSKSQRLQQETGRSHLWSPEQQNLRSLEMRELPWMRGDTMQERGGNQLTPLAAPTPPPRTGRGRRPSLWTDRPQGLESDLSAVKLFLEDVQDILSYSHKGGNEFPRSPLLQTQALHKNWGESTEPVGCPRQAAWAFMAFGTLLKGRVVQALLVVHKSTFCTYLIAKLHTVDVALKVPQLRISSLLVMCMWPINKLFLENIL